MPRLFRGHVPYWGAPLLLKKRQSVKKINPHVLKNVIIQTMSSGSTLGGGEGSKLRSRVFDTLPQCIESLS